MIDAYGQIWRRVTTAEEDEVDTKDLCVKTDQTIPGWDAYAKLKEGDR